MRILIWLVAHTLIDHQWRGIYSTKFPSKFVYKCKVCTNLLYSKYWSIEAAALWSSFRCTRFPAIFFSTSEQKVPNFLRFQNNTEYLVKCGHIRDIERPLLPVFLCQNRCQASVKTRQKQICEIQMQENLIANSMCLSRFSSTIVRIFLSKQVCYGSSSALETYLPWCCCKQDWRGESSQNLSSSRDRPNWLPLEGRWLGSQIQG